MYNTAPTREQEAADARYLDIADAAYREAIADGCTPQQAEHAWRYALADATEVDLRTFADSI
jgi:hypothetical protein